MTTPNNTIQKGDFVELSYQGTVGGEVFDSTEKMNERKSLTICVGQSHILKGVDASLEGKEVGKNYHLTLAPEDAFGRKDARLIQMIPKAKFSSQKINPQIGMQLNIDNQVAIVRQVSGGRILVDFNHPLAGREVEYAITPLKKVEKKEEQVKALISMEMGLPEQQWSFEIKGDTLILTFPEALKVMIEHVKEKLAQRVQDTIHFKKVELLYSATKEEEKAQKDTKGKEGKANEHQHTHEHLHDAEHPHEHHGHEHHQHHHASSEHGHHDHIHQERKQEKEGTQKPTSHQKLSTK